MSSEALQSHAIVFPREWFTAPLVEGRLEIEINVPEDGPLVAVVFGVLLDDGSNLHALDYNGGTRFVRTASQNGWSIEERFEGEPPQPEIRAAVDAAWKVLLDSMIRAGEEARAELDHEREP